MSAAAVGSFSPVPRSSSVVGKENEKPLLKRIQCAIDPNFGKPEFADLEKWLDRLSRLLRNPQAPTDVAIIVETAFQKIKGDFPRDQYLQHLLKTNPNRATALLYACLERKIDIEPETVFTAYENQVEDFLEKLISNDIFLATPISKGKSQLHLACEHRLERLALQLIGKGCCLTQPDEEGNTPLHDAAGQGLATVVKALLKNEEVRKAADSQNKAGDTPLFKVCGTKNSEVIRCFANSDCDPFIQNREGLTALQKAADLDDATVASVLCQWMWKQSKEKAGDEFMKALDRAVQKRQMEVAKTLFKKIEKQLQMQQSKLLSLVREGPVPLRMSHLLYCAAYCGNRHLLEGVESFSRTETTFFLEGAIAGRQRACVSKICEWGDVVTHSHLTQAVEAGDLNLVSVLFASINPEDQKRLLAHPDPLSKAIDKNQPVTIRYLLRRGAVVQSVHFKNAACHGQVNSLIALVRSLLDKGGPERLERPFEDDLLNPPERLDNPLFQLMQTLHEKGNDHNPQWKEIVGFLCRWGADVSVDHIRMALKRKQYLQVLVLLVKYQGAALRLWPEQGAKRVEFSLRVRSEKMAETLGLSHRRFSPFMPQIKGFLAYLLSDQKIVSDLVKKIAINRLFSLVEKSLSRKDYIDLLSPLLHVAAESKNQLVLRLVLERLKKVCGDDEFKRIINTQRAQDQKTSLHVALAVKSLPCAFLLVQTHAADLTLEAKGRSSKKMLEDDPRTFRPIRNYCEARKGGPILESKYDSLKLCIGKIPWKDPALRQDVCDWESYCENSDELVSLFEGLEDCVEKRFFEDPVIWNEGSLWGYNSFLRQLRRGRRFQEDRPKIQAEKIKSAKSLLNLSLNHGWPNDAVKSIYACLDLARHPVKYKETIDQTVGQLLEHLAFHGVAVGEAGTQFLHLACIRLLKFGEPRTQQLIQDDHLADRLLLAKDPVGLKEEQWGGNPRSYRQF